VSDEQTTGSSRPQPHRAEAQGKSGPDATVSATAQLPALDEDAQAGLRELGAQWAASMPDRDAWERALPVDPCLEYDDTDVSTRGRFVQIRSRGPAASEDVEATPEAATPDSMLGRVAYAARRVLIGRPLRSVAVAEERMNNLLALAVLSPDALSSVAYGPEAMLAILVLAGASGLSLSLPIAGVIAVLMISVGLGYRQVIRAYPHGGGSYIVAGHNLGANWGLLAGAGLIVDYIVTVAVSVASGVAAVISAIPSLSLATVPIGLGMIALLVAGNLRGVRGGAKAFAAPTYLFIVAVAVIVIVGLIKSGAHGFHASVPHVRRATEAVGILLILRAFASGSTAMTGIEVISNAVPVFRPPEARNARKTLSVMLILLVSMFAGVVIVARLDGATPGSETVLSQIAHHSVGGGVIYAYVQVATALILLVAANSAFNGFPRLLFFMARDGYVPRSFLRMGDRLAFTYGISVLAVLAAVLYAGFRGQTEPLIPLYAIGVFLAFTLAQGAMVVHWWRHRERGWRSGAATNMVGAVLSGIVVVIAAITKFAAGAWVVVLLIPLIVVACRLVHRHYARAGEALKPHGEMEDVKRKLTPVQPPLVRGRDPRELLSSESAREVAGFAVVAVAVLDLAALRALAYAASLGQPVLALHVSPSRDEAERFHSYWRTWGEHLPLEVVVSPYRAVVAPLAHYIEALHRQRPDLVLTVVVPELVVRHSWQRLLHNRVAQQLRKLLIHDDGIVITSVPFQLPA